jgi:glycosyltransferase involved in cell wall biosynthesis
MILLEALNVSHGGAHVLLEQLILSFEKNKITYFLVIGKKYPDSSNIALSKHIRLHVPFFKRKTTLKKIINQVKPTSVLCFGNFPLPFKLPNIPTYTYFHRPHLTGGTDQSVHGFKDKFFYILKRFYLQLILQNSDWFIFQSNYIKDLFLDRYKFSEEKTLIIPFYNLEKILKIKQNIQHYTDKENAFIYVSNDALHKNHLNLLLAWEQMSKEGMYPKLYLTLPKGSRFEIKVEELNEKGCNIKNMGFVEYAKVLEKTNKVKYAIFPSLAETLGLGLVEAAIMGAKILSSDLPYVYEVITPSLSFNPKDPNSIVFSVKLALKKELIPSRIVIENKIDFLIQTIVNENT